MVAAEAALLGRMVAGCGYYRRKGRPSASRSVPLLITTKLLAAVKRIYACRACTKSKSVQQQFKRDRLYPILRTRPFGQVEICPLRMGYYRSYNLSVGALRLSTIEGKHHDLAASRTSPDVLFTIFPQRARALR